jgi:tetratricopeptide (TPR) repeat protein
MSEPSPDDPTFVPTGGNPVPPPADATFPAGFLKEEFVGEGGMGIVFRARDLEAKRTVAVKLLRDCFSASDTNAKLFVAEAELTAQLQHPGVPPVHRVGTLPNGRPFMVMKLIRGDDLRKVLDARRDPRDELPRFLTIFEAIVDTLAFAHDRKPSIIHRDLKPANVVVGKYGEVQVLDWGLAKSAASGPDAPEQTLGSIAPRGAELDDLSRAAGPKGTPAYMAPEQALDEADRIGPRSDVFGLGAILCKILTGLPPFEGAGPNAILAQAAAGRVEKAHKRIDECGADPELIAIAKKCLAKEPEDRYAHAGELAHALRDWRAAATERQKRAEIEAAEKRAAEAAAERAKELYLLALNGFNAMVFDVQAKLARRSNTLDLQKQVLGVAREGLQQLTSAAEKHGTPDRTLIWTHYQMGDVYLTLGSTADAQREYAAGSAIAQRLAESDPSDAQAQRDLSISFEKLGNVVLQLGKVDEARGYYARSLEVAQRLAESDPSDAQAQRDLSISFEKLGDVVLQLGKVDEARGYYARSLEVAQRLAESDPSDAQAQRDLLVSFYKFGQVHQNGGQPREAIPWYQRALAVARQFAHPEFFAQEIGVLESLIAQCQATD